MGQKKEHNNLIKEYLKRRGITQTWFAKELSMSVELTSKCKYFLYLTTYLYVLYFFIYYPYILML